MPPTRMRRRLRRRTRRTVRRDVRLATRLPVRLAVLLPLMCKPPVGFRHTSRDPVTEPVRGFRLLLYLGRAKVRTDCTSSGRSLSKRIRLPTLYRRQLLRHR